MPEPGLTSEPEPELTLEAKAAVRRYILRLAALPTLVAALLGYMVNEVITEKAKIAAFERYQTAVDKLAADARMRLEAVDRRIASEETKAESLQRRAAEAESAVEELRRSAAALETVRAALREGGALVDGLATRLQSSPSFVEAVAQRARTPASLRAGRIEIRDWPGPNATGVVRFARAFQSKPLVFFSTGPLTSAVEVIYTDAASFRWLARQSASFRTGEAVASVDWLAVEPSP